MPGETEVDATLVLYLTPIAVTLGVEGGVGIGIEPLEEHHTECVRHTDTGGIDGGEMPLSVDGGLTVESHSRTGIAIVEAEVQEVAALSVVSAIESL